jgi:MYXO-CTERM domain-containing protein
MVARKILASLAVGVLGVSWTPAVGAQVFQTDAAMTPLPQPVGTAEVDLITNSWARNTMTQSWKDPMTGMQLQAPIIYGEYYSPPAFPQFVDGDAITLQGLFKWRGEKLDPVADAKTAPGYFSPTCGFQGQLLLMGGNCKVAFGWYNVEDPNSTTAPTAEEIFEFIPNDPAYLNCLDENGGKKTDGFCPLAWDTRSPRDLSIQQWTPKAFDSGNIKTDPRYKGKYVGFALIGNPALSCKANKYSMYNHNQKNAQGQPWVASLIYQSTADPEGFYMAFEDLPMSTADWRESGGMYKNDGDFNDFVFYVSGISCLGGGQPCDTGLQGACSLGRTDCAAEGTVGMCRPIIAPGTEACDNVDNDCNGTVDDGEGLCAAGEVCDKGTCVGACGTGEFRCDPGYTCKAGHCIEDACADKVCAAGEACRNGECKGACAADVKCPAGEECQLGRCVDPCKAVTCAAGKVCERGLCVSDCACRGCKEGLECAADGRCTDPKCVGVMCAAGEKCEGGTCVDQCAGVVCPGGGACVNGACQMGNGTGTGGSSGLPGDGITLGGSLTFGGSSNSGPGSNNGTSGPGRATKDPGCACEVVGSSPAGNAALLLAGLATALATARRRKAASRRAA